MKKKEKTHRIELTLIVAAIVFVVLLITIILTAVIAYILIKYGKISGINDLSLSTNEFIIILCSISLILGAVFATIISEVALQPINLVISRMNRLASGDFKARLQLPQRFSKFTAIKEVSDSFNQMADELENTEILREDFINNFSHEFKTPIVSILGFAKLLKHGNITEEQKLEYIDIVEKESLRLSHMATNVLNMTKYENQIILTDVEEFNLSEQIRNCILALEGKWNRKKIDLNLNFEEYMITANQDMFWHMWMNLIDNAIKFSKENGEIIIDIKEELGDYIVSIANEGEKMTKEQEKKIFNKFYQADESHATEGNGVGLALVKKVVELHNGEISVKTGDGKVVFFVNVPKKQNK